MEIQLMNTLTGLEAGINRLQNPSFVSRIFQLSGIGEIDQFYSFWTWGALILAFLATFSSIIKRTKLILLRLSKVASPVTEPLFRFSDDDETCSSSDDEEEEEEEGSELSPSSTEDFESRTDKNFQVANSGRFYEDEGLVAKWRPWLSSSGSVVKLWDGIGLGNSGGFVSMWDLNRGEMIRSFFTGKSQIPAICMASPAVVMSAGVENMRNVAMKVWDARIGGQNPAAVAEWQPRGQKIVGIDSGGAEKVYVSDDVSTVVRDLRNVRAALPESDVQTTWFDADAVMVDDENECFENAVSSSPASGSGSSVVSRCRNAVRSYLF